MNHRDYTIPVKSSLDCGLSEMIKLLIVDDQPAVRKGLRMRLAAEPDLQVVGEAADGEAALSLAQELHPDIVLLDMEMPHMDGIATTDTLHKLCPLTLVIMLTIHDDAGARARAENAGAAAFIPKSAPSDMLLATIRQIGH
jgi:two-component system, NarL family, response regulator NreC